MFLQFLFTVVFPVVGSVFSVLTPLIIESFGGLIQFSLSRVGKIPLYIQILTRIYNDSEPNSQIKKYVTTGLLILGGILSFMANSFVPFTAVPLIGIATAPIAILFSLVVILLTMDLIVGIDQNFFTKMETVYGKEVLEMEQDISTLKTKMGPKWNKIRSEIKTLFDKIAPQIDELQQKLQEKGLDLAIEIDKFFKNELSDLVVYLSEEESSHVELKLNDIEKIKESLDPWTKVGGSFLLGAGAGSLGYLSTAGAASSVFAPATFGNSILAAIGLKSSILVSASTYALLTTLAPVAVGITLGAGVVGGSMALFKKGEEKKASEFLADTIIASVPMMRADGHIDQREKDAIYQMMNNSLLRKEDCQRIENALSSCDMFEDLVKEGIINDPKREKREIKRKLILTLAWEIAKADGDIHHYEIELHDRMARIMNIPQETVNEIRRLITPKLFLLPPASSSDLNINTEKPETFMDAELIEVNPIKQVDTHNETIKLPEKEDELVDIEQNLSDQDEIKANTEFSQINHSAIDSNIQEVINQAQKTRSQKSSDWFSSQVSQQQSNLPTGEKRRNSLDDDIFQIINEQVNKVVQQEVQKHQQFQQRKSRINEQESQTFTTEQIKSELKKYSPEKSEQFDQKLFAKKEQYRQLILVKIDDLEKALTSSQITEVEYQAEMEKVRSHIESYKQLKTGVSTKN